MPRAQVGGVELEYQTLGAADAPPMLLVMGLGAQLTRWPEAFCRGLAEAGYRVIVFDNRDVGLSSRVAPELRPNLLHAGLKLRLGRRLEAPYLLHDMALDAVGLLDHLGYASAHVVGVSMGSMIAQIMAARHPARVASFTSIMSTTGSRRLPQAALALQLRLFKRPKPGREERIKHMARTLQLISSPAYPPDPADIARVARREVERSPDMRGTLRQLLAIMASGSRRDLVRSITAPTLIVHGAEDPLVPVAAAHDLHEVIAGSRLEIFPGMGHDLPAKLTPRILALIVENAGRATVQPAGRRGAAGTSDPPAEPAPLATAEGT